MLLPTSVRPTITEKFPVLLSYAMVRGSAAGLVAFKKLALHPQVELLLDSGAFTALNAGHEIPLDEYLDFLHTWKDSLFGYLALDVVGDPKGTDANLQIMLREGLRPVPVHVRGDGQKRMDELFEMSPWVACGGLRRPHVGWCAPSYLKQKMIWARGRDVHWLGYTRRSMLHAFKPYSCDSSNWSTGARFGTLDFGSRIIKEDASKARLTVLEQRTLHKLGFTMDMFRDPSHHRGGGLGVPGYRQSIPFMVTAYTAVQKSRALRRTIGTREFLAVMPTAGGDTNSSQSDLLIELIGMTA